MHGVSVGSLISRWMRSGPGGGMVTTTAPSSSATGGASSVSGSDVEIAKLRRVGMLLTAATVTTFPFTSRMRTVTGQMTSREPAKTVSVPLVVRNGQDKTIRWAVRPGTSMRKAIWFTSLLSQSLARRASAGNTLEKVLAVFSLGVILVSIYVLCRHTWLRRTVLVTIIDR